MESMELVIKQEYTDDADYVEIALVPPVDLDKCTKCGNKLEFLGFWRDANGWVDVPAFGCPACYLKNRGYI